MQVPILRRARHARALRDCTGVQYVQVADLNLPAHFTPGTGRLPLARFELPLCSW